MPSAKLALAKIRWSLNNRGVAGTLKAATTSLVSRRSEPTHPSVHPFDEQHGVDTSGLITSAHLATGQPNDLYGTGYCGVPPSRLRHILERWAATPPLQPIASYSFIDIGCGKGRAILLATELPFAQLIGVELNAALAQTALANLEIWHTTHPAPPTVILTQDATTLAFPDSPCLLYLYNPFAEPVVRKLIDHIERCFSSAPRPLDILYYNPVAGRLFADHPSYELCWNIPVPISDADAAADPVASPNDTCSLYRRVAQPQAP